MELSFLYQNIQVVIYLLVLRKRLFHLWALHQRSSRISKNKLLLPSWVGVFCCFELPLAPDSLCCSLDCRGLPSTRGELCIYFPSWGVAKPGWMYWCDRRKSRERHRCRESDKFQQSRERYSHRESEISKYLHFLHHLLYLYWPLRRPHTVRREINLPK